MLKKVHLKLVFQLMNQKVIFKLMKINNYNNNQKDQVLEL